MHRCLLIYRVSIGFDLTIVILGIVTDFEEGVKGVILLTRATARVAPTILRGLSYL